MGWACSGWEGHVRQSCICFSVCSYFSAGAIRICSRKKLFHVSLFNHTGEDTGTTTSVYCNNNNKIVHYCVLPNMYCTVMYCIIMY